MLHTTHPAAIEISPAQNYLTQVLRQLQLMLDKRQQRKQLAGLTIRHLIDMGIDPADALSESQKPFWK
jgi:uncharacterized protein YjiS (DUF1127 family)